MKHYIHINDAKQVQNVFKNAKKKLAHRAKPLWELYILYLQTIPDHVKQLKQLYDEATKEAHPDFDQLKCSYIEWGYQVGGIVLARVFYRRTCKTALPCLEIHNKMAEFELLEVSCLLCKKNMYTYKK